MKNVGKMLSFTAAFMLVFVMVWPVMAADKTFELTIPGCTS